MQKTLYLRSTNEATISTTPAWKESDRLEALRRFEVLDTPFETEFDEIAALASQICDTPIAIINLIDEHRQWFKSEIGFGVRETPLDNSICRHVILQSEMFVVPDTTKDPRFNCNPLVTDDPNLRFYAGALLQTEEGLPLGTLCVLDYKPRVLSETQLFALKTLARQVMTQMHLRLALKEKEQVEVRMRADITEHTRLRAIAEGQKKALEMSMQGAALTPMLEVLIHAMEANSRIGVRASVLLLSPDKKILLNGAAPSLPKAYNDAIHGIHIGEGIGSCGTAAYLAKTYVASDISTDPYWTDFKELALRHGLHACWSTPIFSTAGELMGTFALYYDKPSTPSVEEYELVDFISRTAGIVIERTHVTAARKLLDEQLIQARNDAETANLAKSEFLANMSHEIRTPMNAVIGLSTILAKSAGLSPKQKEFIHTLQLSADSLLGLINDLLDIAKIETRNVELEHIPFSVVQIVQETISMINIRAKEKGLSFNVVQECACIEQRMSLGDPTRLRQILLNLCSNAIKFTETGGISIHVSCTAIPDKPDHELIKLAVKDTGIGIPADKIGDIFQKFTQADSSINRKYGGTGLGLAITKTLAEIMGGTIELESELGKGSTFTVSIPLEITAQANMHIRQNADPAVATTYTKHTNRILLVEDYAPNILVATTFLETFGYTVDVAENALSAIEKIKHTDYAIVLMDVQMPGMNGFEATQQVRAYERQTGKARVHIIGMTAHALVGDRERCIAAGMDDYISKPFNPDILQEMLQACDSTVSA